MLRVLEPSFFFEIMKKAGKEISAKDQAALKVAAAKRMAAHEDRSQKKARTTSEGGETNPTGKPPAGPPKAAGKTEDILQALAGNLSSEEGEEDLGSDSGEETEEENFGSVAKPVARESPNGRKYEMIIGQGAGFPKKAVSRKDTFNLAAEELGRELTVNEKKVLAQMSPEELKQASEEQGVKLVEMIKGLPGCEGAASEVNRMIMEEGHDINAVSVFVVCLAAMDGGAIPGTPDCVGAQGPAGLARRLGTLQHMGRINGNGTKGAEAGEPAASERQRGTGGGTDPSFQQWTGAQEVASFSRADELTAASLVEAHRRQGGKSPYTREQTAKVLKAIRAPTSDLGKNVCANAASAVRKYKPEADEAAINKLTRGSATAAEMERTIKKALGMSGDAETDMVLMLDAAWALEQIDRIAGVGLYSGATSKLLKMIAMTGRVDEGERRKHMEEMGDIYFKSLHQDLHGRLEHVLFGGDEDGGTKTGSMSEEVKDDVRQLIAKIKSMTSGRRGAAAAAQATPSGQRGAGGAAAAGGSPSASTGSPTGGRGRTYCSKYFTGQCSNSAACGLPHREKEDIECPFLKKGSCFKGGACDWKH